MIIANKDLKIEKLEYGTHHIHSKDVFMRHHPHLIEMEGIKFWVTVNSSEQVALFASLRKNLLQEAHIKRRNNIFHINTNEICPLCEKKCDDICIFFTNSKRREGFLKELCELDENIRLRVLIRGRSIFPHIRPHI